MAYPTQMSWNPTWWDIKNNFDTEIADPLALLLCAIQDQKEASVFLEIL